MLSNVKSSEAYSIGASKRDYDDPRKLYPSPHDYVPNMEKKSDKI
jgi:hypothetical protein